MKLKLFKQLDQFNLAVDVDLKEANIIGVFGSSGAGKSSFLRCISGLEKNQYVAINNQRVSETKQEQRGITLQLQSCPLFPHLDVAGNLAFTFKHCQQRSGVTLEHVIDTLELQGLLARKVDSLSGGEKQRVLFARTLLTGQKTILLDEPFSALDWLSRYKILRKLLGFAHDFTIKFVIVSHSLKELVYCCDTLLQLEQGQLVAAGSVADVMKSLAQHKQTKYSILACDQHSYIDEYDMYRVPLKNSEQYLIVTKAIAEQGERLLIPSSSMTISPAHNSPQPDFNTLQGQLVDWQIYGNECYLDLMVDGQRLFCQIPRIIWDQAAFNCGDRVSITVQL